MASPKKKAAKKPPPKKAPKKVAPKKKSTGPSGNCLELEFKIEDLHYTLYLYESGHIVGDYSGSGGGGGDEVWPSFTSLCVQNGLDEAETFKELVGQVDDYVRGLVDEKGVDPEDYEKYLRMCAKLMT